MIDSVAIKHISGIILCAYPPARHHDLIQTVMDYNNSEWTQGFLTEFDEFLTREEALIYCKEQGQELIQHGSNHPTKLFSEDLW